ncbi:ISL3 family transposase [Algoriphagus antarcticus]|jgi:transposase|uniref:Transposase n=1 Tax=Algoriphagus antarcticus TaxID=238540 RepID=A0A3E0DJQ0_9BACT|nr:ISL3 family transposase [Algoriphagus antarcticus]REG82294.1 transposase [Algoriphagus antarcticus]
MFTENFFTRILDLEDGWAVESVDTDFSKEEISIHIVCLSEQLEDTQTGELCKIYDHAPARKWRHLDTMQYKTYIKCELPRIITSEGKVKTVQPNWASGYERHTFLFEHAVIDLLKASKNQTKTAQIMRCGFNVVNRIMHLSTKRGMGRRNYTKLIFDQLSIDEKSFKKGHQYITVLSHPGSGCVLDVEEDRTKEACKSLFNRTLTETQLGQVTTISMDMWPAYINSAQELLPNAAITHDRFHLIMYLNKAIDQVRRREVKHHDELKNTRFTLLKNPENFTEKQRIKYEAIADANYEVSKAWQVRENFKDLFSCGKLFAWTLYNKWTADSKRKNIKEIDKVVETFNNHISGVVNALIMNLSNAMAERLNGKIQELKTVGKGYRTFANFRSAILFFHGGLDLYPH